MALKVRCFTDGFTSACHPKILAYMSVSYMCSMTYDSIYDKRFVRMDMKSSHGGFFTNDFFVMLLPFIIYDNVEFTVHCGCFH